MNKVSNNNSVQTQMPRWNHVHWLGLFIATIACLYLLILPIYNFCLDAYGIYRSDYTTLKLEPNLNYVKTKHVLANPDRYDTYALGSSRVGHINMQAHYGEHAYNLTFPEAIHSEQLQILRYLIAQGVSIKRLILGVDDVSFHISLEQHRNYHRTRVYPTDWLETLSFHAFYLLRSPNNTDKQLFTTKGYQGHLFYQVDSTGRVVCPSCEKKIEKYPELHLKNKEFDVPRASHGFYLEEELAALKSLIELAHKHNIVLDIFVNPLYEITYLDVDLVQFNRFKRELAQWSPFYDFSGLNEVTTARVNYSESSHYRPHVGEQMLNLIDSGGLSELGMFGSRVTKDNVEQHITLLEQQFADRADVQRRYQEQQDFSHAVKKYGVAGAPNINLSLDKPKIFYRCGLGLINGRPMLALPKRTKVQRTDLDWLMLSGWSAPPDNVQFDPIFFIRATRELTEQQFYFPVMNMIMRRDIQVRIPQAGTAYLGFDISYDASELANGDYVLEMFRFYKGNPYACHQKRLIRLEGQP